MSVLGLGRCAGLALSSKYTSGGGDPGRARRPRLRHGARPSRNASDERSARAGRHGGGRRPHHPALLPRTSEVRDAIDEPGPRSTGPARRRAATSSSSCRSTRSAGSSRPWPPSVSSCSWRDHVHVCSTLAGSGSATVLLLSLLQHHYQPFRNLLPVDAVPGRPRRRCLSPGAVEAVGRRPLVGLPAGNPRPSAGARSYAVAVVDLTATRPAVQPSSGSPTPGPAASRLARRDTTRASGCWSPNSWGPAQRPRPHPGRRHGRVDPRAPAGARPGTLRPGGDDERRRPPGRGLGRGPDEYAHGQLRSAAENPALPRTGDELGRHLAGQRRTHPELDDTRGDDERGTRLRQERANVGL